MEYAAAVSEQAIDGRRFDDTPTPMTWAAGQHY
jgi:hypothetical protein